MSRRRWYILSIIVAALSVSSGLMAGSAAIATTAPGSTSVSPAKVSTPGKRVEMSAKLRRSLAGMPADKILALLSVRDGLAFYRLGSATDNCFGVGAATSIGNLFQIMCWEPNTALMDLSIVEIASGVARRMRLVRVAGIAADGIASVGLRGVDGTIVARTAVNANVYSMRSVPISPVESIVGFDDRGRVSHELRLGR